MSNEFASADLTAGQLNALVKKLGGSEVALNILRGTVEVITKVISFIVGTYTVAVNYDRSITDSVKVGSFNWSNDSITDQNFPSKETGKAEVSMALFHFKTAISSENAIEKMKLEGYRPATMKELLAFGENNPEVQREFPIVALGSVAGFGGYRHVGYLYRSVSKRGLSLYYLVSDWHGDYRFLAVRN